MEVNLFCILVSVIICKHISVTAGFAVEITRVKIDRNGPKVRRCASEIGTNQNYIGGRVSILTGVCEKILSNTSYTQTKEPGYEYIEKQTIKRTFRPPAGANLFSPSNSNYMHILGPPVTHGAKLDITFHRTPPIFYAFYVTSGPAVNRYGDLYTKIYIWIEEKGKYIAIRDFVDLDKKISFDWRKFCPSDSCKISLVFKDPLIEILANDQQLENNTAQTSPEFLARIERVTVDLHERKGVYAKVISLEYTNY